MKKRILLLAALTAFSSQPYTFKTEAMTYGSWKLEAGSWKFYDNNNKIRTGWIQTASGWYYLDSNGTMLEKWQQINGAYYYFDTNKEGIEGRMHTGWYQAADGSWYFFNNEDSASAQGQMLTGWQWIDGYCYYFEEKAGSEQGGMYAGKMTPDGYNTDAQGHWTDKEGKAEYSKDKGFTTNKPVSNSKKAYTQKPGSTNLQESSANNASAGNNSAGGSSTNPAPENNNSTANNNLPSEETNKGTDGEKGNASNETNMDKLDIMVDGITYTYYYKKYDSEDVNAKFIVKGKEVSNQVRLIYNLSTPEVYYYVEDEQRLSGAIYGIADIPYAYFYQGELYENPKLSYNDEAPYLGKEREDITGLKNKGYDAVSSATANSYGQFETAVYSKKTDTGYKIAGVKTPVKISAELYVKASLMLKSKVKSENAMLDMISSMTQIEEATGLKRELTLQEPKAYKEIYYNAAVSELRFSDKAEEIHINASELKASVDTQSDYADYMLKLEGLPSEINTAKNLLGVLINIDGKNEASESLALCHLDNISVNPGELGISTGIRGKGSEAERKRFKTVDGHKITKITYLLSNYKKVVIDDLDLYLGKQPSEATPGTATVEAEEKVEKYNYNVKLKVTYKADDGEIISIEDNDTEPGKNNLNRWKKALEILKEFEGKKKYEIDEIDAVSRATLSSNAIKTAVKNALPEIKDDNIATAIAEAEVERYNYKVILKIIHNKVTGEILSVQDNGTKPKGNSLRYWKRTLSLLKQFKGKRLADIDSVDAISRATLSSNAVKAALKSVLNQP